MEPEVGTPTRVGQLDWLLDDLVRRVAPITKAVILSQDGMTLGASQTLERITGLNRYALARQFRACFGTSPYRYLTMRRLDRARATAQAPPSLSGRPCRG